MSEVSNLYSSPEVIYRVHSRRKSDKGKNGDVKHIVFKDGQPVYTEIIRVNPVSEEDRSGRRRDNGLGQRPVKRIGRRPARSNEVVLSEKKKKLSDRLKRAMSTSETLWSEKTRVLISYQGNQRFLVKRYSETNQVIEKNVMSRTDLLECAIPGILDTGWIKV